MYILTVEDHFASAHQLREYKGKCENIHGHNWKIELTVSSKKLNNIGLVLDFGDMKRILKEITDYLDHTNLNLIDPFHKINPSSENIAKYIFDEFDKKLMELSLDGVKTDSVTCWESHTSRCTYKRD